MSPRLILLSALSHVVAVGALATFPSPDWRTERPELHGLSSSKLQDAAAFAKEQKSGCFAVIRDGVLVQEDYAVATPIGPTCMNCSKPATPVLWDANTTSNIHSSTKSITSILVGIAQDLKLLDIQDPVYKYGIPSWAPPNNRSGIRVVDVLSMDSGLHWAYYEDYFQGMFLSPDKTTFGEALTADRTPGTYWEYNNLAVQTLEAVLRNATGQDVASFAQHRLFSKIGLGYPREDVGWYRDQGPGHPIMFDGIQLGCRTLARVAYLWLNNGSWAGEQVVSERYVRGSVQPSTKLNAAYGHLWWLGKAGHWVLPSVAPSGPHGGRVEGNGTIFLPGDDDMYAMLGGEGQVAIVHPTRNAIYVRQGEAPPMGDDNGFVQRLLRMIQDAYVAP